MAAGERSLTDVPRAVWLVLLAALILQVAWQGAQPRPVASAAALGAPPPVAVLRVASLGEPVSRVNGSTLATSYNGLSSTPDGECMML